MDRVRRGTSSSPEGGRRHRMLASRAGLAGPAATSASIYLDTLLPGGPRASIRMVEALVAARPHGLARLDHSTRRILSAAMMVALARHGEHDEAVSLAEHESDRRLIERDVALPSALLSRFWSAESEAFTTAGRLRDGLRTARRALRHAEDAGDDALRYRAFGLLAANLAMSGEFAPATTAVTAAVALEDAHGWGQDPGVYLLRIAQTLIASARMDVPALTRIAENLRGVAGQPAAWRAIAALAEAAVALAEGRPEDGLSMLTRVAHSADVESMPPLMSAFLASDRATLLISRGEPQRALALLEGHSSDAHHTVCFDLRRSSAHLQLGDPGAVLAATAECLRLGAGHNLRTLAAVLLRRAIAFHRLGNTATADAAFTDAFGLIRASGAVSPLLTLPKEEMQVLGTRLRADRPDLAADIDQVCSRGRALPTPKPPPFVVPTLTARESLIARRLRSTETLAEIGRSLYVSTNTVKTQTSSLYRKLGVSSRAQAVEVLDRAGFFGYPD